MGSGRTRSPAIVLILVFLAGAIGGFFILSPNNKEEMAFKDFLAHKKISYTNKEEPQDSLNLIRMRRLEAIKEALKQGKNTYSFIVELKQGG